MLAVNFRAMGCQMQALCQPKADSNSDIMAMALEDLPNQVGHAEQRFSRFLADSELMQLNQRSHRRVGWLHFHREVER